MLNMNGRSDAGYKSKKRYSCGIIPSKSSVVKGTPNSLLIETTMSAVGNNSFLTVARILLALVICNIRQGDIFCN